MTDAVTIPLLPCRSINDILDFYRALGFEVAYQQAKPNNYAVVQRGGIELHFFSMKEYVPANSYSSCYVRVGQVDPLYEAFRAGLRARYGRVPSAGNPARDPAQEQDRRASSSSWTRAATGSASVSRWPPPGWPRLPARAPTRPGWGGRSTPPPCWPRPRATTRPRPKMLDPVLAERQAAPPAERLPALVFRAGLALTMDDPPLAEALLVEARTLALGCRRPSRAGGRLGAQASRGLSTGAPH